MGIRQSAATLTWCVDFSWDDQMQIVQEWCVDNIEDEDGYEQRWWRRGPTVYLLLGSDAQLLYLAFA
jgi:hypothetical protein